MRVFLFGAGASHSYGRSPTGVMPPLATGFFRAFNDLDISGDPEVKIGNILGYVRDTRGIDAMDFMNFNENIESFLSEVEAKIHTPAQLTSLPIGERYRCVRLYDEMVFLFSAVLNEIQNGPVSVEYAQLVSTLEKDDTLVTLNWDTLLDRALADCGRWFPDDGYSVAFEAIYNKGFRKSVASRSKWRLLKLHGSTNWFLPYSTRNFETGEVVALAEGGPFCFHDAPQGFPAYHDRGRGGYEPFSYFYYPPDLPGGSRRIPTIPLLVPPIRDKDYRRMAPFLDALWTEAARAIECCD
jgi:hypothetical protein